MFVWKEENKIIISIENRIRIRIAILTYISEEARGFLRLLECCHKGHPEEQDAKNQKIPSFLRKTQNIGPLDRNL